MHSPHCNSNAVGEVAVIHEFKTARLLPSPAVTPALSSFDLPTPKMWSCCADCGAYGLRNAMVLSAKFPKPVPSN